MARLTPSQWQNGRRGQDGWGRWTRRRKWYRDAELVEADDVLEEDQDANGSAIHPHDHSKTPTPAGPGPAAPRPPPGLTPTPAVPTVDLTPSSPDGSSLSPPSSIHRHPPLDERDEDAVAERDEEHDTASMLSTTSTSSRSVAQRGFTLRRRPTDSSHHRGSRRASVAASTEDDAAVVLDTRARMAMQEAGGEAGSWGVGDEVRMGLE